MFLFNIFYKVRPGHRTRLVLLFICYAAFTGPCLAQGDGGVAARPARPDGALSEWQRLQGPAGGAVRQMHKATWGSWYAGSEGGVFRSDDDGMTWQGLTMLPLRFNTLRALLPISEDIIVVCTDRGNFRSSDAGNSWTPITPAFHDISLDSSGVLCGLLDLAVHVSPDSGVTWTGPTLPATKVFESIVYQLHAPARGMMLALSRATLYRSFDEGMHWDSLAIPFSAREGYDGGWLFGDNVNLCMAILPSNANLIWIYTSSDTGRSWTELALPVDHASVVPATAARGGRIGIVERQSAACRARLHVSTDGGRNWSDSPLTFSAAMFAEIRPDGDLFVSTWDDLHRVDANTGASVDTDLGHTTSTVRAIHAVSDSLLIAVTYARIFRSSDAGRTWSTVLTNPECYMIGEQIVSLGDGSLLVSGADMQLTSVFYRSNDCGQSWQSMG